MAFSHSQQIVYNGFVTYLDAANNRSYPGSGTTWTDLTRNNNNGTLTNGPTFSTANGGIVTLDGTNDYIDFSSVNFGNEMTVMCFVRPRTTSTIQTIFGNSGAGTTTNGVRLFYNTYTNNNRIIVAEVGNGSAGDNVQTSGAKMVYDAWQHVAFVLNKNTTKLKIYYNGILEIEKTPVVNNYTTNGAFRLGTLIDPQPSFYILKGDIGNYIIYTRELSAAEIFSNFNATRRRFGV